jgi:hypothetical protein
MTGFDYLSVLLSIVIGLGLSHLVSSTARLIQARRRVRVFAPVVGWVVILFLAQVQIWWAALSWRSPEQWSFLPFLVLLLLPTVAALLSVLVLPDFDQPGEIDMESFFFEHHRWFFLLFASVPLLSLTHEALMNGFVDRDLDTASRTLLAPAIASAAFVRSRRFHMVFVCVMLVVFLVYTLGLFGVLPQN